MLLRSTNSINPTFSSSFEDFSPILNTNKRRLFSDLFEKLKNISNINNNRIQNIFYDVLLMTS